MEVVRLRGSIDWPGVTQLSDDELDSVAGDRVREKALVISKYRFVIAIENSIAYDYITEKVKRRAIETAGHSVGPDLHARGRTGRWPGSCKGLGRAGRRRHPDLRRRAERAGAPAARGRGDRRRPT